MSKSYSLLYKDAPYLGMELTLTKENDGSLTVALTDNGAPLLSNRDFDGVQMQALLEAFGVIDRMAIAGQQALDALQQVFDARQKEYNALQQEFNDRKQTLDARKQQLDALQKQLGARA